jgi:transcriptional regulator with GAF, ATPase, and Fis domain
MNDTKSSWMLGGIFTAVLLLAGCGGAQKDATEAAVDAAQKAVNSAQETADKYAPELSKAAQDALQSAKDALAKSDYQGALEAAKEAVKRASDAISTTANRKEEWSKDWKNLSATVPKTLEEAKSRLDAYTKKGKLPPRVTSDQMAEAQAQYEKLKQAWADANAAYQRGNIADAIKKAGWVQESIQKLKELLGIKS